MENRKQAAARENLLKQKKSLSFIKTQKVENNVEIWYLKND